MRKTCAFILLFVLGPGGCCSKDQRPPVNQSAATPPPTQPPTRPARLAADAPLPLFDGKTLDGWKSSEFAGGGEPRVEDGNLVLPVGERLTGVSWTGAPLPRTDYEISLEAQRVDGSDFFCGLTFPVGDSYASLIIGGWGGTVCGISNVDGEDAAHNDTRSYRPFKDKQWYRIRTRVTPTKIESWLNDEKIVDLVTTGKQIALRNEIDEGKPLGLASFQSTAAIRNLKLTRLAAGGN